MAQAIEKQIAIAATADVVWKALVDDTELVRWFPLHAVVKPGQGGSVQLSWGEPAIQESTIEVWSPNKQLRLKETKPFGAPFQPADGAKVQRSVDFSLSESGGRTTLKLEHSGFGDSAEWQAFVKNLSAAWDFQLQSLNLYVTKHHGLNRAVSWSRSPSTHSPTETWSRVTGPGALLSAGSFGGRPGQPYSFTAASGDTFAGDVLTHEAGKQFAGSTKGGLVRVVLDACAGKTEAGVWVADYHPVTAQGTLSALNAVHLTQSRITNLLQNALH